MADKTGYIGRNPNDSAVTVARQFFTASGVTTTFTFASGYLTGFLDVYVDGVKRRVADEFTATDGSTFDVLQGGVSAGSTVEAVAYKAFNATTISGDITGNFDVSGNSTLGGSLDVTGGTTLSNLNVTGITTLGAGTSVGFANTAFNISGTPDVSVDLLSAVDINVSGAATIGGILTYEDVTNIDSVGIVTARTGVEVTANGLVVNAGVSTFAADVSVADKIVHTGDANTAIRFPSNDTFSVETAGSTRLTVASSGDVTLTGDLSVQGGDITLDSGAVCTIKKNSNDIELISTSGSVKLLNNSGGAAIDAGGDQRLYSSGSLILNTISTGLQITGRVDPIADSTHDLGTNSVRWRNVYADTFVGALTGAVTGNADTATTSTNITVADESSDTTCFPLFVTGATGNLPPKSGTNLTFNSSTGALTATSFVGAVTGDITGNADTATTATNVTVADESSDTSCNVLFTTAATGNLPPKSGTNLTFNSSTGALTATSFVGALTGNVTGNATGLSGTPNISCGTGAFSGNLTLQANLVLQDDNDKAIFGAGDDLEIYHNGTDSVINDTSRNLLVRASGTGDLWLQSDNQVYFGDIGGNEIFIEANDNGDVKLFYDNSQKLATKSDGIDVTGEVQCDSLDVDGTTNFDDDVAFTGASYNASWDKSANSLKFADNAKIAVGSGEDLQLYHNVYDSYIDNTATGDLYIRNTVDDKDIVLVSDNGSGGTSTYILCDGSNGQVNLYHYGSGKLNTSSSGVTVTGTLNATTDVTINGKSAATTGKAVAMAMVFG